MFHRLKSLAGQSMIYGLGSLLPKAIGFLLLPLYTRYLTPADYGILAFVSTLGSILVILYEFGQRSAVTRFYYDYLDQIKEQRHYLGTIWLFLTLSTLALSLLIDWQGERLFDILFKEIPYIPYGRLTVWMTFLAIASVIPLTLFRVREQAVQYVAYTVGRFILITAAIIFFVAVLGQGAEGSLKGQLLAAGLIAVPFTITTFRSMNLSFSTSKLKASLDYGLPMIPHQLSGWALTVSDRFLLERNVSLDQLGLYSLGYRLAMILDLVLYSINMAWSPFFFRTAATEKNAPQIFARVATYYSLLMLLLGLGIALLARDVIIVMATPAYYDAYQVVPVVVLAYVMHGFYYMIVNQLFYTKHTRRLALYTVISASVNIILNILTIPKYGIMAAAWNTVIGYTTLTILVFIDSNRVYPVPYEYRRIAIAGVAAGITYVLASAIHLINPYFDFIARLAAISLFPSLLFVLRFFDSSEISGMRNALARAQKKYLSR